MKKFLMLSMLVCGAVSGAWGAKNCSIIEGDLYTESNVDERFDIASNKGYVCDAHIGDKECPYGAVIVSADKVVQCNNQRGVIDKWVSFKDSVKGCTGVDAENFIKGRLTYYNGFLLGMDFKVENGVMVCKDSSCYDSYSDQNFVSKRVCKITNEQMKGCFAAKQNGDHVEWKTDNGGYCHCNDNNSVEYEWNKSSLKCEPVSKEQQCKDGKIYDEEWEVDCVAEGFVGGLKCGKYCTSTGTIIAYVTKCQDEYNLDELIEEDRPFWEGKYKRCVEKKKQGETEASKQRKISKQKKSSQQKCVASGGDWHGDNGGCKCDADKKNLVVKGLVCECKEGFKRDNVTNECKITDLTERKNKCDAASASGAYWDNDECKCRDIRKDFVGGECTEKADIQKCNRIEGAEWSDSLVDCVCKDPEKTEFNENKTACVEKAELREKREAEALIARVKKTHQELQKLERNVWKDEQGNFNTARLVSDSVAGVVLGTAGGLITSSVVKKNQVENGFEDLKCTVGGQIVADWGDQFRVGIQ